MQTTRCTKLNSRAGVDSGPMDPTNSRRPAFSLILVKLRGHRGTIPLFLARSPPSSPVHPLYSPRLTTGRYQLTASPSHRLFPEDSAPRRSTAPGLHHRASDDSPV